MIADFSGNGAVNFTSWGSSFNTVDGQDTIDTFVPEPSSYLLCASGLAGAAMAIRRVKTGVQTLKTIIS